MSNQVVSEQREDTMIHAQYRTSLPSLMISYKHPRTPINMWFEEEYPYNR